MRIMNVYQKKISIAMIIKEGDKKKSMFETKRNL